jgi:hypothetical protein
MDEFEQRFIVKYFHLKKWEKKKTTAELESTFQGSVLARAPAKRWLRKFKTGDLSCSGQPRPGRLVLKKFLEKHPFTSAKIMSRQFRIFSPIVKKILSHELGLQKYTRRWVPHELSEDQKKSQVDKPRMLLERLQ